MGEPVKIMDLAHDLVRLAGRDPESQPIEIVGLRPGEKLHEELFYAEERVQPTENPKVLRAAASQPSESVRDDVARLMSLASGHTEELLRRVLEYARGQHHESDARDPRDRYARGTRPQPGLLGDARLDRRVRRQGRRPLSR
jgi:FlaA1/EpsC-like NDP-sugar epimerase